MKHPKLKNYKEGTKCQIYPTAFVGFEERGTGSITLGDKVRIRPNVILRSCGGNLVIGSHSVVGANSIIHALGGVVIGQYVLISPNVGIYAQNHGVSAAKYIALQKNTPGKVVIQDDVWIGANVCIVGPCVIHKGAIIGAGAVITKDVPENAIMVGNPSVLKGYRK